MLVEVLVRFCCENLEFFVGELELECLILKDLVKSQKGENDIKNSFYKYIKTIL